MSTIAIWAALLAQEGATSEVYKKVGDAELRIWIHAPKGHAPADKRPAIVFFFGGGWNTGTPTQFEQQCRYLASRGMVAATADYRVKSRHGTKAVACVSDGKSAVRWLRANAARLGIDPERIAAGGGSAGGHVAACTGLVEGFEEAGEDPAVSSIPNALVLFNPALLLGESAAERTGVEPYTRLSPFHNVRKGAPPTLVLTGKADETTPFAAAEQFAEAMRKAGNRCELEGYEGCGHGFFNYGRKSPDARYGPTVRRMDAFLNSLGWLDGEPTLRE